MKKALSAAVVAAVVAVVPFMTAAPAMADDPNETVVCVVASNDDHQPAFCVWVPVGVVGCNDLPPNQVCK